MEGICVFGVFKGKMQRVLAFLMVLKENGRGIGFFGAEIGFRQPPK